MLQIARKSEVIEGLARDAIPYDDLLAADRPFILKGVARHWPLVEAGLQSAHAAADYLKRFSNDRRVVVFEGEPAIKGRFAYNADVSGMNFKSDRAPLGDILDRILAGLDDPAAPSFYIGSTDVDLFLPGLRAENDLVLNSEMFTSNPPMVSAWIGNRTTALAHYDMSNNVACCVAGRRRFILFPPDQIENLYPGPLEPTPGGQVVTMTNLHDPDFARFPRLKEALAAGEVADLEPGDAVIYPAMWWHQVEALEGFNILINYWWNTTPRFMDTPQNTLLHALLSLRDRPEHEKRAWRAIFDYYIFGDADRAGAHLPEAARGNLAPMDDLKARRLRAYLLSRFNR